MPDCLICQERFGGNPDVNEPLNPVVNASIDMLKVVATKCGHLFHQGCIFAWMQQKGAQVTCPMCNKKLYKSNLIPIYTDWGEAPVIENTLTALEVYKLIEATKELSETKARNQELLQEKLNTEVEHENQLELLQEQIRRRNECIFGLSRKNTYQERLINKAEESILRLKKEKRFLQDALLNASAGSRLPERSIDYNDELLTQSRLESEFSPPLCFSQSHQSTGQEVIDLSSISSQEPVDKNWSLIYDLSPKIVYLSQSDLEDSESI